jgi:hypothetical protein
MSAVESNLKMQCSRMLSELRRDPVCLLQILMRTLIHDADLCFRLVYRSSLWSLPRAFFANFGVD